MDRGIEPHIPVWDKSRREDGTLSRPDFTYDKGCDLYICPGGKTLNTTGQHHGPRPQVKTTGKVHEDRALLYRASKFDCQTCPLKRGCCPKARSRRIPRDIDEDVRDHVCALASTEAFERSRRERKKVEMAVAHLKRIFKLDRLRLRGLSGARDEIPLAATVQNLGKLAIYAGRSLPGPRAHCTA